MMVKNQSFKVVLQREKAGGYSVYVPELPGCISQGETKEEALANIAEAIELYVDDLSPQELETLRGRIQITTAKVPIHA